MSGMYVTLPPTLLDHPDELAPFVTRRTLACGAGGFLLGTRLVEALGGVESLAQAAIAVVLVLVCAVVAVAASLIRIGGRTPESWAVPLWRFYSRPRRALPRPERGWRTWWSVEADWTADEADAADEARAREASEARDAQGEERWLWDDSLTG